MLHQERARNCCSQTITVAPGLWSECAPEEVRIAYIYVVLLYILFCCSFYVNTLGVCGAI